MDLGLQWATGAMFFFFFPRFGSALVWLTLEGFPTILVLWSPGPLVLWSSGPLVLWSSGPVVLWFSGALVPWSSMVLVLWSSGPLVLWSLDPLVFGCGFWKDRNTANYSLWKFCKDRIPEE